MNAPLPDDEPADELLSASMAAPRGGLLARHPKLAILLIAGVFYALLAGMALVVFVLLIRS